MKRTFPGFFVLAMLAALVFSPATAMAQPTANLLKNLKVTDAAGELTNGKLTVESLTFQDGQLLASGVLKGKVNGENFTQAFEDVVVALTDGGDAGVCDILNLDIGEINLDLLGLVIDISPIEIDITAERGPNKLLGNLLCALTGLLDTDLQNVIGALLDAINQLLK